MATLDDFEVWSKNLYRFYDGVSPSGYMSDTACLSAEDINHRGADFLNDKSRLRERIPEEWLIKEFGVAEGDSFTYFYPGAFEELDDFIGVLTIKDVSESSGNGITFLEFGRGDDPYDMVHDIACASPDRRFLVTEFAQQHEYARRIFPCGANSLRFLVYAPEDQECRITACVQKWSTHHSGITDNWNKGGLTTLVVNGVMLDTMEDFTPIEQRGGNGSTREPMFPGVPNRFKVHPETGVEIMGKRIPFWRETVEMVLTASEILRDDLPYIGWDVIITEEGPKIIEGNPWPGIQLIQVHIPLFNDIQFREFMAFHNVKGL